MARPKVGGTRTAPKKARAPAQSTGQVKLSIRHKPGVVQRRRARALQRSIEPLLTRRSVARAIAFVTRDSPTMVSKNAVVSAAALVEDICMRLLIKAREQAAMCNKKRVSPLHLMYTFIRWADNMQGDFVGSLYEASNAISTQSVVVEAERQLAVTFGARKLVGAPVHHPPQA